MSYSENQLNAQAKDNPKELVRILTSPNADVRTLTYGAEILGSEVTDEELVLPALRMLLKHVNAIVREGAMLGVSSFYLEKTPHKDILDRLKVMVKNDPSPSLKEFAQQILEEFESK